MKIALDVMGGDHAPNHNLMGAKLALEEITGLEKLYLVGNEDIVRTGLQGLGLADPRIEIVPSTQVIDMVDASADALRKKKDSSITVAIDLVKQGLAQGVFSPGHTGASVAVATLRLGRLHKVERPGIASPLPNEHGICNLVDAGANPEAKALHLVQYAIMGSVYAHAVQGVERPVVGLMSIGEEDEKGTDLTREVFSRLRATDLNFKGNVEGHHLFETPLHVVVCDGFVGNVVLKSCEATAKAMMKWIRHEIEAGGIRTKLGALMAKPAFVNVKKRGSYESYGGSPLLGTKGIVIIGHGSSSPEAIKNGLRMCAAAIQKEVNPHIEEAMARYFP
jgi:glycerol-3-phosphate acyltransferase PlsX